MNPLSIALSQYGQREIIGSEDNPVIVNYFNFIGQPGEKLKDETSWCSAFMGWVFKTAGKDYSNNLMARSWLNYGEEIEDGCQIQGDIVIFWRESPHSWKGHVGLFINEIGDEIYVLGGNQSNQVCIAPYSKTRLLGYRRIE